MLKLVKIQMVPKSNSYIACKFSFVYSVTSFSYGFVLYAVQPNKEWSVYAEWLVM